MNGKCIKVNQQKQHTRNVRAETSTAPNVSSLARIRNSQTNTSEALRLIKGQFFARHVVRKYQLRDILNHIKAQKHMAGKEKL